MDKSWYKGDALIDWSLSPEQWIGGTGAVIGGSDEVSEVDHGW